MLRSSQRPQNITLSTRDLIDELNLALEIRIVGAQLDTIHGLEQVEDIPFANSQAAEDFLWEDDP